eukprot:2905194-Rhodomonas_salina.3
MRDSQSNKHTAFAPRCEFVMINKVEPPKKCCVTTKRAKPLPTLRNCGRRRAPRLLHYVCIPDSDSEPSHPQVSKYDYKTDLGRASP